MVFPSVDGENLVGAPVSFPRDFNGARTIALVAFDLKHRGDCETWVPFIDRFARDGTARGRLFPVIPRAMRSMKRVILTTMRQGAPEPEARAATVPLFVDLEPFCAALEIADRKQIQAFIIEPDGSISERRAGRYDDAAGAAFTLKLTAPIE